MVEIVLCDFLDRDAPPGTGSFLILERCIGVEIDICDSKSSMRASVGCVTSS
jgi:hypothetical protein